MIRFIALRFIHATVIGFIATLATLIPVAHADPSCLVSVNQTVRFNPDAVLDTCQVNDLRNDNPKG